MNIFFEPNILQNLQLSEDESRHAIKVLRLSAGDLLYVVDGIGNFLRKHVRNMCA